MPSGSPQSASFENDVDRFHLLVDAVTDYAIYLLDRDGRVASWNVGAERLKGYSAAEAIGQPYWRFFSEEDQRRNLPARLLAEAREKGRLEIEGWRVRKDRSRFFAFAVIHKIEDERGRHIGFAKVTRDITERKQAQEALRRSATPGCPPARVSRWSTDSGTRCRRLAASASSRTGAAALATADPA